MRNAISLLSAAVFLVACGDKQESTAPTVRVSSSPLVQAQSSVDGPTTAMAGGKATGWTQAWTYVSPSGATVVAPGGSGNATIKCPVGTTMTGGGFVFDDVPPTLPPLVETSGPDVTNTGWFVVVHNYAGSGGNVSVRAIVRCAS